MLTVFLRGALLPLALSVVLSSGCGPPSPPPSIAQQLVGRWRYVSDPRAVIYVRFAKTTDTTGTLEYTVPGFLSLTLKGTWQVEGRTLTWHFTEVPEWVYWSAWLGGDKFRDKYVFDVVRISAQELALQQSRVAFEERYERLPE